MLAQATAPRGVVHHALCAQEAAAAAAIPGPWRQAVSGGATVSWRCRFRQACWAVVLVALSLAGLRLPAQAQLLRPFTVQFTDNRPGDIYIIGNTLFSCDPRLKPTGLEDLASTSPPFTPEAAAQPLQAYQTCDPNIAKKGEGFIKQGGKFVKAEGIYLSDQGYSMGPINLATPMGRNNSSSAEWQLPAGASVLWAGLYWSARSTSSGERPMVCHSERRSPTRLCFKTPASGGYALKTGTLGPDLGFNDVYQNFVEVTNEVHAGGSGTYSVADVDAEDGNDGLGFFAGWALVIVIRDPTEPLRNLTVFNG
ncbi:MAG TPA: hypothetical protein VI542_29415, partial [Candidatus Tectomicrobia bacterium]